MESAQWTTVALDVRVLLLSVLGFTVIAFVALLPQGLIGLIGVLQRSRA